MTIATNMAGRGTDIMLGGNPAGHGLDRAAPARASTRPRRPPERLDEALAKAKADVDADHDKVVAAGGLHIIGTERHEARRIDNQLRGRAGRQGDPGSSRFYLSLEDTLMKRFASDRVAGPDGAHGPRGRRRRSSRAWCRKTIESAQSRVEGYNFDIRKRVVEYDDVINKQRETIYAERDKVLRNEDLTDTVRDFVDDEIDALVDQHMAAEAAHDWDFDGLARELTPDGPRGRRTSTPTTWPRSACARTSLEHLREAVDATLEKREQELGEETWAQVERLVLLRTIDQLWVDHLTELDDMRRGIGLRGYGGTDPLNEFKREAFKLYEELRGFISKQVANNIFRVQVQQVPQPADVPDAHPVAARRRWRARRALTAMARRWTQITPVEGGHVHLDGTFHADAPPAAAATAAVTAAAPAVVAPALAAAARRGIQYTHGDEPGDDAGATAASPTPAKAAPDEQRPQDRPQRPVLVRQRQEIQALPRELSAVYCTRRRGAHPRLGRCPQRA